MNIDSIQDGVVLDHIKAGKSMDIYKYLHLDQLDCSVAIIKNVRSARMGKKDIIKIDSPMEVDLDVLGYIDPDITVNIIRIVTTLRQDALKGLISKESPVAKAILGHRAGETVRVELGEGRGYELTIQSVEKGTDDASLDISRY